MALTYNDKFNPNAYDASAAKQIEIQSIDLDNSYPTGGYEIDPTDLGYMDNTTFMVMDRMFMLPGADPHSVKWDYVNGKLMVLDDTNVEVANGTDLSTVTDLRIVIIRY